MKVIRLLVYEGREEWIQKQLAGSIQGKKEVLSGSITAITLGVLPSDLDLFIKQETDT